MKTLGLDLGTNSLGWAVLDEDSIQAAGVLVFEEGVNREQSDSLETPAATRRAKRMARRLRFRRHLRRRLILKILIEQKMCPLLLDELKAWSRTGVFPKDNTAFIEWLKSTDACNPYCDRAKAATEKVDPLTLGRAVYHLAQRRGFKSGRKDQLEEGDETSKAAKELGLVKGNIAQLTAELATAGLTLGQYFHEEINRGNKVRNRHTGRVEHYQKEWAKIADIQGLTTELTKSIDHALFWQRPLREQSHLVGKCALEPNRRRALIGHPDFETFRALSFVNNIRLIDGEVKTPLTAEQRAVAADCFIRKSPLEFKDIRKKLEKQFKDLRGSEFNYLDNTSLPQSQVTAALNEVVPSDIQKAFDALTFFDDNEKLLFWGQKQLNLSPGQAATFVKIRVPEGRAGYSLHAIRKINRFLRQGIELSQAIFLAKTPDIIPDFDAKEKTVIAKVADHNERYRENKHTAYHDPRTENRFGVLSLEKRLRSWLEDDYGIRGKTFNTLYFRDPKADASYASIRPGDSRLPPVNLGMIRNPLVQRSMTMLRKLVNELRKSGSIDAETRIHIELARGVNDRNRRMAIQTWQKQNEDKRNEAREKLLPYTSTPSDTDILKYILALEQDWRCLYTGKQISINGGGSLFSGFDIEHTLPRSRSGDDSQANLTLCDITFNRTIKKDRLPTELTNHDEILVRINPWQEHLVDLKKTKEKQAKIARSIPQDNPDARSRTRQKMLLTLNEIKYWQSKIERFTVKPEDVTPSFIARQLVDTGVMTRHAVALLKTVYPDTYPVNGQAVAFARKMWKVQGTDEAKDRSDHTHHAKDAMVIAALTRARFQKICTELKTADETRNPKFSIAPPFENFAQAVFDNTSEILVKHVTRHNELKQTRRKSIRLSGPRETKEGVIRTAPTQGSTVRGRLHKDSFYGKIQKPGESGMICVIRKELSSIKESDLNNIVDPVIRTTIQKTLAERGDDFKKAIAQGGFKMASGVPIKKVRVEATTVTNPKLLRLHAATPSKHEYKNPYYVISAENSNFGLVVYQNFDGTLHFIAMNLLEYVQGKIPPAPEGAGLAGRILPGAMAIAYQRPGEWTETSFRSEKRLYKVENFSGADGRILLRFHKEARKITAVDETKKSSVDFQRPHALLRLTFKKAWSSFLFEGIHFKMGLDGKIEYMTGDKNDAGK